MSSTPKRVTILGATGSIGRNTLDIIRAYPNQFEVIALTAHRDVKGLAELAIASHSRRAVVADVQMFAELKELLSGTNIEVAAGAEALREAAQMPADIVISGIVGIAGLAPTMAAICAKTGIVGLACKESLVCAGALMTQAARDHGVTLLPIDSEHHAAFDLLHGKDIRHVEKLYITASGGPFRDWTEAQLEQATPAQAVAHPIWRMGAKISIDCATMMNKALECIEAHFLFPELGIERIETLLHPQSLIHAMLLCQDGSIHAHIAQPDMRLPISYSLFWPERITQPHYPLFDLMATHQLQLLPMDMKRWRLVPLAKDAVRTGGNASIAFNAANEVAVAAFIAGNIRFPAIVHCIEEVMAKTSITAVASLEDIYAADRQAREVAQAFIALAPVS